MLTVNRKIKLAMVFFALALALLPLAGPPLAAQSSAAYFYEVRSLETRDWGVAKPVGVTFHPASKHFEVVEALPAGQTNTNLAAVPFYPLGSAPAKSIALNDPLNLTFSLRSNKYWAFDRAQGELDGRNAQGDGAPAAQAARRLNARGLSLQNPQGMTVDPKTGQLFILDAARQRIVRITPDANNDPDPGRASAVSLINLPNLGTSLRGIAFNPNNNHLYVMNTNGPKLYELTVSGALVSTRNLAPLRLAAPQGMVFAPSAPESDEPDTMDLYIADSGGATQSGRIVELSLIAPVIAPQYAATAAGISLINTVKTWQWSPPSPDPAGVAYDPGRNRLIVSDSEVEEAPQPYWRGVNMWETSFGGNVLRTFTTFTQNPTTGVWNNYSNEPTGLAINPNNGHLFVSDDTLQRIWEIDPGPDNKPGTADDNITWFSTSAFGDNDTEDVAYAKGKLYVTYGFNKSIFVVDPGANGKFDGVPPAGDDSVTSFDVGAFGVRDVEGLGYDPVSDHLLVVDKNRYLVEVTRTGGFVKSYDLKFLNPNTMADAEVAPSSVDPSVNSVYIVDRMVDNGTNPNENDGLMYEISIGGAPPPPTNTPTKTNTPAPNTPTNTPTITPTPTPGGSTNLLLNPGFELDADNNGKPDSWTSSANFTRSSDIAHSGSFAGKHFSTADASYNVNQTVSGITPGALYNFSGWVNIPPTSDSFTFTLDVRWRDSAGTNLRTDAVKTYSAQTTGWDQATTNFVAPANAASAVVRMNMTSLNATIYVDDFSFGQ